MYIILCVTSGCTTFFRNTKISWTDISFPFLLYSMKLTFYRSSFQSTHTYMYISLDSIPLACRVTHSPLSFFLYRSAFIHQKKNTQHPHFHFHSSGFLRSRTTLLFPQVIVRQQKCIVGERKGNDDGREKKKKKIRNNKEDGVELTCVSFLLLTLHIRWIPMNISLKMMVQKRKGMIEENRNSRMKTEGRNGYEYIREKTHVYEQNVQSLFK